LILAFEEAGQRLRQFTSRLEALVRPRRETLHEHGLKAWGDLRIIATRRRRASPGGYLLLCSDGLTAMLGDPHITGLIPQGGPDVQAACEALVARANAHGGEDNVSVILAYHN
jgi:serine/threonine protein phosphatase PrpC